MKVHIDRRQRLFSHSGIKEKSWEKKLIPIEGGFVKCLDCYKSYSSMHAAKKHFKEVHLKLISFKCLHCEKSFTQKGNLRIHVKNVHKKTKDHTCKFCGKGFDQKINLRVHVDRMHSIVNV